jgi:hypothetical protein
MNETGFFRSEICVIVHPMFNPLHYFEYNRAVRYFARSFRKIVLFVDAQSIHWVRELYFDLCHIFIYISVNHHLKREIFDEPNRFLAVSRFYELLSDKCTCDEPFDLSNVVVKGFGLFDIFRHENDVYRNVFKENDISATMKAKSFLNLYSLELLDSEHEPFVLPRDLLAEQQIMHKLNKLLMFKFGIISHDDFIAVCHKHEISSINIKRLFPKSHRMSHWIQLLQKSTFIVVSDDEVGAFVHTLQNETIDGQQLLHKNHKVFFVLPLNKQRSDYPIYYKWSFIDKL